MVPFESPYTQTYSRIPKFSSYVIWLRSNKSFPVSATTVAAILDFLECPRAGITHPAENIVLDHGQESIERKTLTQIKELCPKKICRTLGNLRY